MALRSLRDMLGGVHDGSVSVKWDGAPAVFAGIDPNDGVFFVAKKGIFNKNPKVYKTAADVDADTSGDLADKLKLALKHLPELGIKGVVQGDFLYSSGDLERATISGQKYITFHPNTIVYAVPADSDAAKEITSSKIGIVWPSRMVREIGKVPGITVINFMARPFGMQSVMVSPVSLCSSSSMLSVSPSPSNRRGSHSPNWVTRREGK